MAFGAFLSVALAWGHEGHVAVALIAEHYMTRAALRREAGQAKILLAPRQLWTVLLERNSCIEKRPPDSTQKGT